MKTPANPRLQQEWLKALKEALQNDTHATQALRELEIAGCTQANLFGFMYAFHRAQALVFSNRNRARNRAFSGLAGVVRLLTRTANSLKDTFDIPMSGEEQFGDWLRERLKLTLAQEGREVAKTHFSPDSVLDLPQHLKEHANEINSLLSELRRELSARRVTNSVYLVQLVAYVAEVTGKEPSWRTIAELIEISAIAAGSSQGQIEKIEPGLLRKNHASFRERNADLYDEIHRKMKDYVSHCRQLPAGDKKPTFYSWNRSRHPSES